MSIHLKEQDFRSFFELPFQIYGARYPFVSPLRSDLKAMLNFETNPFFSQGKGDGTYFTAFAAGRPVGRIVAHVHHEANQKFNEQSGSFGFFDCIDDVKVAQALLQAAEDFARKHQCDRIRGNMNLSANQEIGVLREGEKHSPYLAQIYNPAHVAKLLEACGYRGVKPMTTFVKDDIQHYDPSVLLQDKHKALFDDSSYVFRPLDPGRFREEVESIRVVLNAAMAENYLFVPMTPEQAQFQLGPLKLVMDPKLLQIAEHKGEVVGVTMCVPDIVPLLQEMRSRLWPLGWLTFLRKRRKMRHASVIIIMVKPAYQSKGVTRVLTYQMLQALKDGGYESVGGTWIGDDNKPSLRSAEAIGMTPRHKVSIYEKELTR